VYPRSLGRKIRPLWAFAKSFGHHTFPSNHLKSVPPFKTCPIIACLPQKKGPNSCLYMANVNEVGRGTCINYVIVLGREFPHDGRTHTLSGDLPVETARHINRALNDSAGVVRTGAKQTQWRGSASRQLGYSTRSNQPTSAWVGCLAVGCMGWHGHGTTAAGAARTPAGRSPPLRPNQLSLLEYM